VTWRGTAGLALLLALLVATIVWVDRRAARPASVGRTPLLTVESEAVTALEIQTRERTLRFARNANGWHGVHDGAATAAAHVPGVLAALGSLAPLMVVTEAPTRLDDFGLGSDAVRLIVRSGEQLALDLEIGNRNPAWTAIYVRRRDSSEVLLVGSLLRWELQKIVPLTLLSETRDPIGSRSVKEAP